MRKLFYEFRLILICLLGMGVALSFNACSDDGDDGDPTPELPKSPYFLYEVELSDDLFDISSPVAVFIDEDGNPTSEPLTNTKWRKEYTGKKFPCVTQFSVIFTYDESKLTKSVYTLGHTMNVTSALVDTKNQFYKINNTQNSSSGTVKKENIERYLLSLNQSMQAMYTLDKEGNRDYVVPED